MEFAINAGNITKTFGNRTVLDGIDLKIPKGRYSDC